MGFDLAILFGIWGRTIGAAILIIIKGHIPATSMYLSRA